MAGLGTLATTNIITKGISGGPACRGLITTHFSLWCFDLTVIAPTYTGNGGSRPFMPGEIQNFYKQVPQEQQPLYYVPRNQEAKYTVKMIPVTIKLSLNGHELEKLYTIPETRAKILINVVNLVNRTFEKIKININNLKSMHNHLMVKMQNLKKK